MKKIFYLLILVLAFRQSAWGQTTYSVTGSGQCASASTITAGGTTFYRGAIKLSATVSGNTATFTVGACIGSLTSGVTYHLKESTSSSITTVVGQSSDAKTSTSSSFTYNLPFTTGSRYYAIVYTNGSMFGCTEIVTIIAGTAATPPSATTGSAVAGTTSATLMGTINPNGTGTVSWFEWGKTTVFGNETSLHGGQNSGTSTISVNSNISGLTANTLYYYRLVAQSSAGTTYGQTKSFTTDNPAAAPAATLLAASNISTTGATLNGQVNPQGTTTYYVFEYASNSTFTNERNSVPENPVNIGSGTGNISVSQSVSGLQPDKTYYYRLYASNSSGDTQTGYSTFTTSSSGGGSTDNCTFPDLPSTSDFYTATCWLYNKDILTGVASENMLPEQNITRLQTAKIAFRGVYSLNNRTVPSAVPSDNYPSAYSDLNINTAGNDLQAAKALLYLEYDNGISPFDRNRIIFDPLGNIARSAVIKTLLETFNIAPNLSNTSNPFSSDADMTVLCNNNPLLFAYMRKAYDLGIITEGRPFANCLRGEAFVMLYRIMTKIEAGTIPDPNPSSTAANYFEPLNVTLQNISQGLSIAIGNFNHYEKTGFGLNGAVPLDFAHTYNSYNVELPDEFFGMYNKGQEKILTYEPLGKGWSHTYHSFVTIIGNRMIVHWGGGTVHIYSSAGTDFVCESLGVYDNASISGGVLTIKTKSQIVYKFKKNLSASISDGVLKLWTITDRNGNTLTVNYELGIDNVERISSVTDGNRSLTFQYRNSTNLISKVSDPLGRTIQFGYSFLTPSGDYVLSGFRDAKNNNNNYYYLDATHAKKCYLLSKIKLPNGNSIENDYDVNRRLTTSASSLNDVIKKQTNISVLSSNTSSGKLTNSTIQTYDGSSWRNYTCQFNSNNNATQIIGNQGLSVSAAYGNAANPTLPTSVESNSNKTNIEYDSKGNVKKITQHPLTGSGSRITAMNYNSRNDVIDITDPKGNVTYYDYDSNGNLIKVRAPESSTTDINVNSKGLPISITTPEGIVTEYEYNTYGNLWKTVIPSLKNLTSTINYDAASRVLNIKDFLNRQTSFIYDDNDNLLTKTDALNHSTSYAYDANDNLITITDAKGGVTTLTYDNITDWLTSTSFGGATKSYQYNDDGSLKKFTKPDGTQLNSSYDNLGRITGDGVNAYEYDSNHRLWKITKGGKTLTYDYNGYSEVTGVTYSDFSNNTVNYAYDANGNITSITCSGNKTVNYTYDNLNRIKSVKDWNNNTITYNYKRDSRLESISYPNGMTATYAYDNAGRQTGKTVKRSDNSVIASYSFTLDNAGNIINENRTEPYNNITLASENVSYAYNSANRITNAGGTSFSFDANGNTTRRGNDNYSYDNLNKLTSGGGYSFEYDGLGNIRSNGSKRYMIDIMGMGNVIAECSTSGTPTAYYIYGAGGLEARILPNGATEYYVSDYRGSVVAMVDVTTSANITHKYQYDEFGNITQKQEMDENAFRYVGKYGVMYFGDNLYYMRARFYDPSIGRFLSEDPIWSINLYPYADNNPIMGIDPEGNQAKWAKDFEKYLADHPEKALNLIQDGLTLLENLGLVKLIKDKTRSWVVEWTINHLEISQNDKNYLIGISKVFTEFLSQEALNSLFKAWKESSIHKNSNAIGIDLSYRIVEWFSF
jgi:RHS repeat-associated protein